ncbi:hypothetical protein BSKO_06068 [Bryopsis sp. KO-2023]|nr:hypothetical protein BSKO_06068 [Bryopsis sp. KO-2023]
MESTQDTTPEEGDADSTVGERMSGIPGQRINTPNASPMSGPGTGVITIDLVDVADSPVAAATSTNATNGCKKASRLCIALEGTAGVEPHWSKWRAQFVEPILSGVEKGTLGPYEFSLVLFRTPDNFSDGVLDATLWTTDVNEFRGWMDKVDFIGGGGGSCALAEGFSEVIYLSKGTSALGELGEIEQHCLLFAISDVHRLPIPWPLAVGCVEPHRAAAHTLLGTLKHCGVSFSVVTVSKFAGGSPNLYKRFFGMLQVDAAKIKDKPAVDPTNLSWVQAYTLLVDPKWTDAIKLYMREKAKVVEAVQRENARIAKQAAAKPPAPATKPSTTPAVPAGGVPQEHHSDFVSTSVSQSPSPYITGQTSQQGRGGYPRGNWNPTQPGTSYPQMVVPSSADPQQMMPARSLPPGAMAMPTSLQPQPNMTAHAHLADVNARDPLRSNVAAQPAMLATPHSQPIMGYQPGLMPNQGGIHPSSRAPGPNRNPTANVNVTRTNQLTPPPNNGLQQGASNGAMPGTQPSQFVPAVQSQGIPGHQQVGMHHHQMTQNQAHLAGRQGMVTQGARARPMHKNMVAGQPVSTAAARTANLGGAPQQPIQNAAQVGKMPGQQVRGLQGVGPQVQVPGRPMLQPPAGAQQYHPPKRQRLAQPTQPQGRIPVAAPSQNIPGGGQQVQAQAQGSTPVGTPQQQQWYTAWEGPVSIVPKLASKPAGANIRLFDIQVLSRQQVNFKQVWPPELTIYRFEEPKDVRPINMVIMRKPGTSTDLGNQLVKNLVEKNLMGCIDLARDNHVLALKMRVNNGQIVMIGMLLSKGPQIAAGQDA